MKVVLYSRVSTKSQDYVRQTNELKEYCSKMKYRVTGIFEEMGSGGKKNDERPELLKMIDFVKSNKVDKVLCWELSRLGRNTIEVLNTIETLNQHCISLFIKNHNIETLDEKCKFNPLSKFMIEILTSLSSMERSQIRERMKSGYDNFRKTGGRVGRKEGYSKSEDMILDEQKEVVKYLKKGFSVRQVMKLTDRSSGTVQKVKRILTSP